MSYTISFTKTFTKGNLKGIVITESMNFVDANHAQAWINAKYKTNYIISDVALPSTIEKSSGHICFNGNYEYFSYEGEIYKAPLSNCINVQGFRDGRWECSVSHAKLYPKVYGFLNL